MGLVGEPRDMAKWRGYLLDQDARFPNESPEYRKARNELLEQEAQLLKLNLKVIAQRQALPPGGLVKDYTFESAADGSGIKLSELFAPGKDSLVIYSMMFPRWSEDRRAGAPGGETADLPLSDQPCPSCSSGVDGLDVAAFHITERTNLAVVAKTSPDRLGTYARERGWRNVQLLSSRNNTFNLDYHSETEEGVQRAVLHAFTRHEDGIRHHWTSELTFKTGDTSNLAPIWPIFGVLDVTPEGRGDISAYPNLQYKGHAECCAPSADGV